MLHYVKIKNLALMDEASLEFDDGFTVVTGETGAGKSVLLGALGILAGNRVEKSIIRQGTDTCEVEANLFFHDLSTVDAELTRLELPCCEDGVLVLKRVVSRKRAGRIQINGSLATLSHLQALGECWIDFHGPGEPQKLFKEAYQLDMLDLFAQNQKLLLVYREQYKQWKDLLKQADALKGSERLSSDEIEFYQNQIATIDALELSGESLQALERDYNRLDQAKELADSAATIEAGLSGDESVVDRLSALRPLASELVDIDSELSGLAGRFDSVIIELEDLAAEYAQVAGGVDFDAETASAIQERMNQWLEVKRKFGPELQSVLNKRDTLANKVEMQSDIEGTLNALYAEAEKLESALKATASDLCKTRQKAAVHLAKKARKLMTQLGFKKADFKIDIVADTELKEHGSCHALFLFSPNAGQALMPLNKIASSGETARVMLSLKAVLAQVDKTPVLVFDEVDANVGGEIGAEVGKELAHLAQRHQVFCVTHLPQVASQGKSHFLVAKNQSKDSTTVTIAPIHANRKHRQTELARMLGDRNSKAALSHAKELLNTR